MKSDIFSTLLEELGEELKIKDLHPDANQSCLIKFPTGIDIQIEPDKEGKFLIAAIKFETLPKGRYRETIFKEALKANGMPYPRYGTFAFIRKTEQLMLFETYYLQDLTGQKLFEQLKPFSEKGLSWKNSLSRGEIPSNIQFYTADKPVGMFLSNS